MYGAIEAGGTKFVCAIMDETLTILKQITIETTSPEETMFEVVQFFKPCHGLKSIGVGSFGPVDINPESDRYGEILNTPKLKWRNFNIYKALKTAFEIPIRIDTDVNAAALAEYKEGYGKGKRSVLYTTIGTGVGSGFVLNGQTLFGLSHPETGHILLKPYMGDTFEGNCPTHGNCLEGLVSGPAIEKRAGKKAQELKEDDPIWDCVADYIGQACMNFSLILSPEVILIGGGVAKQSHLFPKIRASFKRHMNGYIDHEVLNGDLSDYIRYPKNGQNAGLIGAGYIALEANNS